MKTLIFDCGGVLVYPRMGDWNIPFGATQILGERARDLFTSKYLYAFREAAHWLDEGQLVADIEAERRLRLEYIREMDARMGWQMTMSDMLRLADDFTDNIHRYGFFEDAGPWLARWKRRFGLGMLSDAMPSILKFMEQQGLLRLFDAAVISTQLGVTKPDPGMYAAILKALDAEPGDCLFVDDRPDNLLGAMEAGMRAAQMARAEFMPRVLWNGPIAHDMEELNGLIETMFPDA